MDETAIRMGEKRLGTSNELGEGSRDGVVGKRKPTTAQDRTRPIVRPDQPT